jgi:hypothetical protein
MEKNDFESYKAPVNPSPVMRHRSGGRVLLLLALSACSGRNDEPHATGTRIANDAAGSDSGAVAADAGSGNAGVGGSSGSPSEGANKTGTTTTVPPAGLCVVDADCDDRRFCNGRERCLPKLGASDIKVCMVPERGPCSTDACDEAAKSCDCSRADGDGDGYRVEGCLAAGEKPDCDDDDGSRNPGNQEVCDSESPTHDEDCDDTTYAGSEGDRDGDEFIDERCLNYARYQAIGATPDEVQYLGGSDCADDRPDSHPGAQEVCDDFDNDCNGETDEVSGTPLGQHHRYYRDIDDDH